jgi:hypothetical protein
MNWSDNYLFLALLVIVSLALAFALYFLNEKRLVRWTDKNTRDLCQRLDLIGVKASISMLKHQPFVDNFKHIFLSDQFILATIKLEGNDIDAINVIGQYPLWNTIGGGVNQLHYKYYNLHFLVRSLGLFNGDRMKKTEMRIKRNSLFENKLVDVEWKGDINLTRKLNSDSTLRDKLLNTEARFPENHIEIFPEPESGYTILETRYFLPTAEQFGVLETVAKSIKQ